LVFGNAGEDSIMADDAITLLNPLVVPIERKELEEAPLDMNVSNNLTQKNRPKKWCAPKPTIEHGIFNCLLTHMP
jgi:hypothetical protein